MDPWLIALILKPLALLAFFFGVYVLARIVSPLIPNGGIKRLLYDKSLQKRHPWKFGLGLLFGVYGTIMLMVYFYR